MTMEEVEGTPMSNRRDTLDVVIQKCLRYKLFDHGRFDHSIKVGLFEFTVGSHDTGCDVSIWIVLPDEHPRHIHSTTYWYSSQYCFNKQRVEQGSWGQALEEVKDLMKAEVEKEERRLEREEMQKEFALKSQQVDEKTEFEAKFHAANQRLQGVAQ